MYYACTYVCKGYTIQTTVYPHQHIRMYVELCAITNCLQGTCQNRSRAHWNLQCTADISITAQHVFATITQAYVMAIGKDTMGVSFPKEIKVKYTLKLGGFSHPESLGWSELQTNGQTTVTPRTAHARRGLITCILICILFEGISKENCAYINHVPQVTRQVSLLE